jgi:hypothetical protein
MHACCLYERIIHLFTVTAYHIQLIHDAELATTCTIEIVMTRALLALTVIKEAIHML